MSSRPIKPAKWEALLAALEEGLNIHSACKKVGIGWVTQWQHRRRDPEFAKRFDEAIDTGQAAVLAKCEAEIDRRALEGTKRPVYQGGVKVGEIREYSDSLLMFRTKKLDPSYRDKATAEINNAGGGAIHVHITGGDAEL